MTEEQVTKAILSWLTDQGWQIVCFDFPQSGTGRVLHANAAAGEKNKASIIPDIVAVKDHTCVFFENKNRFYLPDYEKINALICDNKYSQAIETLLSPYAVSRIFYGIGIPAERHTEASRRSRQLVDFIVGVDKNGSVRRLYEARDIFG